MLDYVTKFVNHTNENVTIKVAECINNEWEVKEKTFTPLVVSPGSAKYIRSSTLKKMHMETRFEIYSGMTKLVCIPSCKLNTSKKIILRHEDDGNCKIYRTFGDVWDITRLKYIKSLWYKIRTLSSKTRFKNYTNKEIILKSAKNNNGISEEDGTAPVKVRAGSTKYISSSMLEEKGKMSDSPFEFKIFSGDEELDSVIASDTLAKGKDIVLGYGNEVGKYLLFTHSELVITHVKHVSPGESGTSSLVE